MELSRRGMLAGVGAACAVGTVGFAGATAMSDGTDAGDAVGDGPVGLGSSDGGESDGPAGAVGVDPDAPFEARLLRDGDDDRQLFDASDLDEVEGVFEKGGEYLVYVSLGEGGIDAFRDRLAAAGAVEEPERFVVSMTLDGTEVRRVELDAQTVGALTDDEWSGVLTLPFGEEQVAESVYDSLASS